MKGFTLPESTKTTFKTSPVLRKPVENRHRHVSAGGTDKKRSSWGPTDMSEVAQRGIRGHRRTPSDGRVVVPIQQFDHIVKVLKETKSPAERGKLIYYLFF